MKKTKILENKAGVSAVIGVILMVAITVAIACTVYVYVTGMIDYDEQIYDIETKEGLLIGVTSDNWGVSSIYEIYLHFDDLSMIFIEDTNITNTTMETLYQFCHYNIGNTINVSYIDDICIVIEVV